MTIADTVVPASSPVTRSPTSGPARSATAADDRIDVHAHDAYRSALEADGRAVEAHAGAALPVIADRVTAFRSRARRRPPTTVDERDLASLHYDYAGFSMPPQLEAPLGLTFEHLHDGSDYPFTPHPVVAALANPLDDRANLVTRLTDDTHRLFPTTDCASQTTAKPPRSNQ